MSLSPCPQCGHMASPNAAACPSCGHPIAAAKKEKMKRNVGIGCGITTIILFGLLVWIIHESSELATQQKAQEKANPTCVSDYAKCADNKDIIEHHKSKADNSLSFECRWQAKQSAKFGEPEVSFGAYYKGRSYLDNGIAILIDNEAKFKNAFGATQKVKATCLYDLKHDAATVTIDAQ